MKIKVTNIQSSDDGQRDIVEELAECKLYTKNKKTYILYTTDENESVMIIVSDNCITVKRSGVRKNIMTFERNAKTKIRYNTPYGGFDIEISTDKIINALNENGGSLRLVYSMNLQGQKMYNDMRISIA